MVWLLVVSLGINISITIMIIIAYHADRLIQQPARRGGNRPTRQPPERVARFAVVQVERQLVNNSYVYVVCYFVFSR